MRFLRTAPTRRLLAVIAGLVAAIAAGTAIAVGATSGGPVPKAKPLANSIHQAMTAKPVNGISAHITFVNHLIASTDFTGDAQDPLLQGATGRIWVSNDGRLRLELQTTNGDAQVVVNQGSFWISDPRSNTVYEGTLPSDSSSSSTTSTTKQESIPTIAQIQADINHLLTHADLLGAATSNPTDVAGRPAYSVVVEPKHSGGLLGQVQLAWDAVTGTPLKIAINAQGSNQNPVLELKANRISYGPVTGAFNIKPPPNAKVVKIAGTNPTGPQSSAGSKQKPVTGLTNVQSRVPFTVSAPATIGGLQRQEVRLLDWGSKPAALVTYGQGLGAIVVVEQTAAGSSGALGQGQSQSGTSGSGLSLPPVNIKGATGTELATALGTVLHYTKSGVAYTLLGSVQAPAAEAAARDLTP